MRYVLLFFVFSFLGMQIPQTVENYTIGVSAVVTELQHDYEKISHTAQKFNLPVETFLLKAKKTDNIFATEVVQLAVDKIPRYLALKAQLHALHSQEILTMTRIVFFEHDPVIWQNVIKTFKPGLYLNLDKAWYWFVGALSIGLVFLVKLLAVFCSYFFKRRKQKSFANF